MGGEKGYYPESWKKIAELDWQIVRRMLNEAAVATNIIGNSIIFIYELSHHHYSAVISPSHALSTHAYGTAFL